VIRIEDTIKIFHSINNQDFVLMCHAYFPDNTSVMLNLTDASPDNHRFISLFEDFAVKHIPDTRRKNV
jgi:regulation of enolase protein 1 (concanavalin A-like superfamily)